MNFQRFATTVAVVLFSFVSQALAEEFPPRPAWSTYLSNAQFPNIDSYAGAPLYVKDFVLLQDGGSCVLSGHSSSFSSCLDSPASMGCKSKVSCFNNAGQIISEEIVHIGETDSQGVPWSNMAIVPGELSIKEDISGHALYLTQTRAVSNNPTAGFEHFVDVAKYHIGETISLSNPQWVVSYPLSNGIEPGFRSYPAFMDIAEQTGVTYVGVNRDCVSSYPTVICDPMSGDRTVLIAVSAEGQVSNANWFDTFSPPAAYITGYALKGNGAIVIQTGHPYWYNTSFTEHDESASITTSYQPFGSHSVFGVDSEDSLYIATTYGGAYERLFKFDSTGTWLWERSLPANTVGSLFEVTQSGLVTLVTNSSCVVRYDEAGNLLYNTCPLPSGSIWTVRQIVSRDSGETYIISKPWNPSVLTMRTTKIASDGTVLWDAIPAGTYDTLLKVKFVETEPSAEALQMLFRDPNSPYWAISMHRFGPETYHPPVCPPVAAMVSVNDGGYYYGSALDNCSDEESELYIESTITVINSPVHGYVSGPLSPGHMDWDQVSYHANSGFSGTDSFTLRITDPQGLYVDRTFTMTVVITQPAAPTNLAVQSQSQTSLSLTWSHNSALENAMRVSVNGVVTATLPANTLGTTLSGLQPGQVMNIAVEACYIGATEMVCSAPATLNTATLPAAPLGVYLRLATKTSLSIRWFPGAGISHHYLVSMQSGTVAPESCNGGVSIVGTGASFSSLAPQTAYSFRVCNVNALGDVSAGATGTFSTLPKGSNSPSVSVDSQ